MTAAHTSGGLSGAAKKINSRKWTFLVVFLIVLFVVVRVCTVTGFIPDPVNWSTGMSEADASSSPLAAFVPLSVTTADASSTNGGSGASSASNASNDSGVSAPSTGALNMDGELPTKVVIPEIGVNTTVANPATTDVNTLDNYLSYGAARYPTSATLDQQGNVIIFGHSSYLPVVINKHYKTFDGIQNLAVGDQITVYSTEHVFTYSVTNVQEQNANDGSIALTTTGHTLTLATCDSFATKSDRFVVTATLVSSSPLGS
jgi:LPXTG-site transpeptidase (sortase) family protein